jgi:hypothetical protein
MSTEFKLLFTLLLVGLLAGLFAGLTHSERMERFYGALAGACVVGLVATMIWDVWT